MTASIISGADAGAMNRAVQIAAERHGEQLRADSAWRPSANSAVHAARAQHRHAAELVVRAAEREAPGYRADARRIAEIADAIAESTGHRLNAAGQVEHAGLRADSTFFANDRVARATSLIAPPEQQEMARMSLSTRMIPAWADTYDLDYVGDSGAAKFIGPNDTNFPQAGLQVGREKGNAVWMGMAYRTRWADAVYSQAPGALDEIGRLNRAAVRAIERLWESTVISGAPLVGLQGLYTSPIPAVNSAVNFSSATLGAMATEITRMLQVGREAAGYAGMPPSVGLIDPRLAQIFRRSNNLDAGGAAVGSAPIMAAMSGEGVRQLIECPTLPASPRGAGYARAVIWAPGVDGQLQQVVGMSPSIVSVATGHVTETLVACKIGGIEIGNASSAIILDIQVA